MASVDVINQKGEKVNSIELDDTVFNAEIRDTLVQRVIVWQLAKRRSGTASTKTRGQISGGGKKPWRQKGTGRARAGTNRSPIWVGGGTGVGPLPRDYSHKLPKKGKRKALYAAFTSKLQTESLIVINEVVINEPKTKLVRK